MIPQECLLLETINDQGFLKGLDPHFVHKLAGLGLEARFEPGQVIFQEGDQRSLMYLICSGSVALKTDSTDDSLQVLGAGDILGWSALLEGGHRHFAARSLTAIHALAFEGEELRKAFDVDPRLGYAIMKRLLPVLATRLEAAQRPLMAAAHAHHRGGPAHRFCTQE